MDFNNHFVNNYNMDQPNSEGKSQISLTPETIYQLQLELLRRIERLERIIGGHLTGSQATVMPVEFSHPIVDLNTLGNTNRISRQNSALTIDYDAACAPLFQIKPTPTSIELNQLVRSIEGSHPNADYRKILSEVKKWFRKKRDVQGQKVFSACNELVQPMISGGTPISEISKLFRDKADLYHQVLDLSQLNFSSQEDKHAFFISKVKAFLSRRMIHRRSDSE
jgi:hypothetical protein